MFNKQEIINYIESRHQKDGGYFFADIEPSSGADTFYAVKILKMLGVKPQNPEKIQKFFQEMDADKTINDIKGLYFILEVLKDLGFNLDHYQHYEGILNQNKNKQGGFGLTGKIYIEVASELQTTYEAIIVAKNLNFKLHRQTLKKFIFSFQNKDGGFGSYGFSLLATTYYALASLDELGLLKYNNKISVYLRIKEEKLPGFYLEDLFWLVMSRALLGEKPRNMKEIVSFIYDCWRQDNGGFCRSRNIGISTFEDTYYATTILKVLEENNLTLFN